MARKRRVTRRRNSRNKLRKGTIYSLFSLGAIIAGIGMYASFAMADSELAFVHEFLVQNFGSLSLLFPLLFIFIGFLFLRKTFLSRSHLSIGYLLAFVSLDGLLKAGTIGSQMSQTLVSLAGSFWTSVIFLAGLFVGTVVFFDTSIDELFEGFMVFLRHLPRFFPRRIFTTIRNGNTDSDKQLAIRPMTIKGRDTPVMSSAQTEPVIHKKNIPPAPISEKLVTNVLANSGIWEYPPLGLLSAEPGKKADRGDIKRIASVIEKTLQSFGIAARVAEVNLGPAVTQYALEIALGTKVSKITSLANDLALATEAPTGQIRIEAPIPGRSLVGIEIPNRSLEIVTLRTMLSSNLMQKNRSKLSVALGLDVSGNPIISDIAKMPHVLIAGTTGSGKSVTINSFIASILFRASPNEVKFILVDPKRVELTGYNGIPHLLTPVIVESEKILSALRWATGEMDRRYKLFAERGVRNIDAYNELSGFQALPYIIIFIDELADLMAFAPVEVEDTIARLAQMARATGVHLVISTQRPSVDVITGLIKANIPCRIAFNVSSNIDSRVILDTPGAEKLLGRGDMLYIPPDQAKPTRIQGAFVSDKEIRRLVDFLKDRTPETHYTEEVTTQPIHIKKGGTIVGTGPDSVDPFLEHSIQIVCQYDRASASLLQRKLSVGYSRAAKILDQLEELGVIGPAEGSKPRDVLVKNADEFIATMHQS